jgi:DNA-binding NarL/FixJ family response regulator
MRQTVLIVDDHEPFRKRVRGMLESEGFEVVGEAVDGESALEAAHRLRPAVMLLDVQLPGMDGFAVAARLAAEADAPQVVLVSSRGAATYRRRLRTSSARGFIAKAELSGECLASLLS